MHAVHVYCTYCIWHRFPGNPSNRSFCRDQGTQHCRPWRQITSVVKNCWTSHVPLHGRQKSFFFLICPNVLKRSYSTWKEKKKKKILTCVHLWIITWLEYLFPPPVNQPASSLSSFSFFLHINVLPDHFWMPGLHNYIAYLYACMDSY